MPTDRVPTTPDLDTELTALCLEERPQLFALAGLDRETDDGGLLGWILAWPDRIVVYRDGHRTVATFRSFAEFRRTATTHGHHHDVRVIPMDGQPTPLPE